MDPFLKDVLTIGLSSCALLISSISLIISWRNYRRDRSHLKLSLDFASHEKQGKRFLVVITNDGRRTATLTRVDALLWFRKHQTIFQQQTVLTEGGSKEILIPQAMFPSISSPLAVRAFEAVDSVGHKYRSSTLWLYWKILFTKN
ncbi:MAG: hypothetical protein L0287_37410 [Anaerolineae bacterium]|nr:hypothetical protein [Anaerolineae bacterium]